MTARIYFITLLLFCLTSACGKDEEKNPHGTLPGSGDMGAKPNTSGQMPNREGTSAPKTPTPTPTNPMPNRVKTSLFFQPGNLSPLETCIQAQLLQQSPDKLASGTVRGPIALKQDASGKKMFASAHFAGKDDTENDRGYTLTFKSPDPRGWTKQIRNLYVGAYSFGIDSKVDVLSSVPDSVPFQLDISSCSSGK